MAKSKVIEILCVILLLCGVFLLLFPAIRSAIDRESEKQAIVFFEETITDISPTSSESGNTTPDTLLPFSALYEAALAYNRNLTETHQKDLSSARLTIPHLDLKSYGFEAECFGILEIPSIGYEVPVYLGSSDSNLEKGAALLGGTSLPISGTNTHAVIAGHNTWRGAKRFDLLRELSPGDTVLFRNPWETLTYRIVSKDIILPDESDAIRIQPNRELLSLLTCTHPNTHRVLIVCEREFL
ncbi:MAG: class C sortase [Clostridia bacterium]|nr:class C sortase [Clostridia bacterium]